MSICAKNDLFSFRTFPVLHACRVLSQEATEHKEAKLILLWRGWQMWQAALQVSSASSVWSWCLWIEALRITVLPTNTSAVSSLLEDLPNVSQDYFCFLIIVLYCQMPFTQSMTFRDLRQLLLVSTAEDLDWCTISRSLNIYYFSPHYHLLLLVQSLKPPYTWNSLLTSVHQLISSKHV